MCEREDCGCYPLYGVAPHECYWRKPGGFENPLGTSTIQPLVDWPDNFLAEIIEGEPIQDQLRWGLCGVFYCPECKSGMIEHAGLMSKETILSKIAE